MERIGTGYKPPEKKKAPHPLFACYELIKEAGFSQGRYGEGYWLRTLSKYAQKKGKAPEALYTELIGTLKEIKSADSKYNKGGMLTNKLKV